MSYATRNDGQGWRAVNGPDDVGVDETYSDVQPGPIQPTTEQLQVAFAASIQQRLDDFARTRNYDGILSACTYATSTNQRFKADADYCVQKRDETWAAAYDILAQVLADTRPMPASIADIEVDLPALVWPA